jgi:hypothetical protein
MENGLKLIREMEKIFEMWRKIRRGFDNYSVSSFGRVRNDDTGRILKGQLANHGYYHVRLFINGKAKGMLLHRLVCVAFYNNPNNKTCVDHIDNNPKNNHIHNLRFATRSENSMNSSKKSNNKSGILGVFFDKRAQKWQVQIRINGKSKYIGQYKTIEEATKARIKVVNETFGEFTHKSQKQ